MTHLNITAYHFCFRFFFIYSTCTPLHSQLILRRKHATWEQNLEEIKRNGKKTRRTRFWHKTLHQNCPFFLLFFLWMFVQGTTPQEPKTGRMNIKEGSTRFALKNPTSSFQRRSWNVDPDVDTATWLPITPKIHVRIELTSAIQRKKNRRIEYKLGAWCFNYTSYLHKHARPGNLSKCAR